MKIYKKVIQKNLKHQLQRGMVNLNYLMDVNLHQNYFGFTVKKYGETTDNPPTSMCVNKIENRATFKFTTGSYLEFLTLQTIELLGATKKMHFI